MAKLIVTLGPSTNTSQILSLIKSRGVDFVRINMSHSSIEDLEYFINLSKKEDIPFVIDTEGSQVRTGDLELKTESFIENENVELHRDLFIGNKQKISIKPPQVIDQLEVGDLLYVDFDSLVLVITDTSTLEKNYVKAQVVSSGSLGSNKGIVIDPKINRNIELPILTDKDIEAISLGLKYDIKHVAASFMRSKDSVKFVRKISKNKMKIISKIECRDALFNLDEIIEESDFLLLDRGDLSKEIPIEKIPFTQKIIIDKARSFNKKVFVATNLLESMIINQKPTRAEVHDIINTLVDGAHGLTLAAETAIGRNPIDCINVLYKIINHFDNIVDKVYLEDKETKFISFLEDKNYLLKQNISSSLVKPHGGKIINRCFPPSLSNQELVSLKSIKLNENQKLDAFQIATGGYSPLKGFMTKIELESVLENLRLPGGDIWPIPILLDVDPAYLKGTVKGDFLALSDAGGNKFGYIKVSDIYEFSKQTLINKLYQGYDNTHPGIMQINALNSMFIGGNIYITKEIKLKHEVHCLTPTQSRKLFDEKNWSKVVGFHTRNAIHRAHEFIQLSGLEKGNCDGLFVHPVVGQKKSGDYNSDFIIESYKIMQEKFYPKNKVIFGVFSTYSRYANEREALFTAICRKNFGCSHFIVGRDHTGVGNSLDVSDSIFSKLGDIGIEIIYFNNVEFSSLDNKYIERPNDKENLEQNLSISGTEAREMLSKFKEPPEWYMRKEISKMLINAIKSNKEVFIK